MQFPVKAHYATLAMLALASRYEAKELQSARNIASEHGIPNQFLGQILQQLRTAGLIHSTRGANGGFSLQRPPQQISLYEIIEAVCPFANGNNETDEKSVFGPVVRRVWDDLRESQQNFLSNLALSELLENAEKNSPMFYI